MKPVPGAGHLFTSNRRNPGSPAHFKVHGYTLNVTPKTGKLHIACYLGGTEAEGPSRGREGVQTPSVVTPHLRGRQNGHRMGCPRYKKLTAVGQWVEIIREFLKTESNTKGL